MENLWKLIEAAAEHGDVELHELAQEAMREWGELKDKLEGFAKTLGGEDYQPQEYPKMVGEKTVYNADEEAKAKETEVAS